MRSYSLLVLTVTIFVLTNVHLVWPENLIQERDRLSKEIPQEEQRLAECRQRSKNLLNTVEDLRKYSSHVTKQTVNQAGLIMTNVTVTHITPSPGSMARDVYDALVSEETKTNTQGWVNKNRLVARINKSIDQKNADLERNKRLCNEIQNRIEKKKARLNSIDKKISAVPGQKMDTSGSQTTTTPIPTGECFCLNKWIQGEELEKLRSACKQVRGKDYRRAEINITKPFQYDPKRKECVGSYEKKCQYYDQSAKTEKISRAVAQDQGFSLSWAHQKCK